MTPETRCFWMEAAFERRCWLRVFTFGNYPEGHRSHIERPAHQVCASSGHRGSDGYQGGHEAKGPVVIESEPIGVVEDERGPRWDWASRPDNGWPADDPRWPVTCDLCSQPLPPDAVHQLFSDVLYRRADTGEVMTWREAPAGAMRDAFWNSWKGPDGISLQVKMPPDGIHDWDVDGLASNCTCRSDDGPLKTGWSLESYDPDPASGPTHHRCWVRSGDPKANPPTVNVDKTGHTCAAGAGSIASPGYHGFLRHGVLTAG